MTAPDKTPASGDLESGYYEDYWSGGEEWTPDMGANNPDEQLLFNRHLKAGMALLDYGCGNGRRYGIEMARRGLDYRGFDISETALQQARDLGLKAGRISPNGEVELEDESMDAAVCFEVLEHLQEPDRALAVIRRVLKPGAVALFSVPNAGYFTHRIEFLLTGFRNPGGSPLTARKSPWNDPHIRFFNPATLRRMLTACGFEDVELHAEGFSFCALPWFYRQEHVRRLLQRLSWPVAWLGRVFPAAFSPRLFLVARKPESSPA